MLSLNYKTFSPDKMKPYALLILVLFAAPQLFSQVKSSKRGVSYGFHDILNLLSDTVISSVSVYAIPIRGKTAVNSSSLVI